MTSPVPIPAPRKCGWCGYVEKQGDDIGWQRDDQERDVCPHCVEDYNAECGPGSAMDDELGNPE